MKLIVNSPFLHEGKSYAPGQEITDPAEVKSIVSSEGVHHVTKLPAGKPAAAPPVLNT